MLAGLAFLYVLLAIPEGTYNSFKFFAKLKKEHHSVFITRTLNEFINQDEILEAYKRYVIRDIGKK